MSVAELNRTNPDTCRHHLARVVITLRLDLFLVCFSCDATLSNEFKDDFHWDYDIDYDTFRRHAKNCRCGLPERWRT